jgi:hypothetical protein
VAVREDDAEPEQLEDESMLLEEGDVVTMAVKVGIVFLVYATFLLHSLVSNTRLLAICRLLVALKDQPLVWRSYPAARFALSEDNAVATQTTNVGWSFATTETEITEGKHYWEVELLSEIVSLVFVGISRPNLDPTGLYWQRECTDAWFIHAGGGGLYGNGKQDDDEAGNYKQGDRMDGFAARPWQRLPPLLQERRTAWAWLPSGQRDGTSGGSSADGRREQQCAAAAECRMPKHQSAIDVRG